MPDGNPFYTRHGATFPERIRCDPQAARPQRDLIAAAASAERAATSKSRQSVTTLEAQLAALLPLARGLTADEIEFFAEAVDAGAVINPRLLRDYLSGVSCVPFQFEGCARSIWSEDQWAAQAVERAIGKRDAFLTRARVGDLRPLLARINDATAKQKAAA